jgi:hypothetical protein
MITSGKVANAAIGCCIRVPPLTGVLIVYVAAALAGGPDVMADRSGELAEIRWVTLAQAGALMSDMAEPARRYLQRALSG